MTKKEAIDIIRTSSIILSRDNENPMLELSNGLRSIEALDMAVKALEQSGQKSGKWIYGEHNNAMCDGYRCDKCGFFIPWDYRFTFIDFINDYHFCPSCGAKMKGENDG